MMEKWLQQLGSVFRILIIQKSGKNFLLRNWKKPYGKYGRNLVIQGGGDGKLKVSASGLKEFCAKVLEKNMIPREEAEVIADSLVDADLIGIKSHGVTKMKDY